LRPKLGGAAAVTALANKLARILYVLTPPIILTGQTSTMPPANSTAPSPVQSQGQTVGFNLVPTHASA